MIGFQSKYYDTESGLYYYYHRYYDPKSGRFLTEDPIGISGGLNLYKAFGNNPVNFIDPRGHARLSLLGGCKLVKRIKLFTMKWNEKIGEDNLSIELIYSGSNDINVFKCIFLLEKEIHYKKLGKDIYLDIYKCGHCEAFHSQISFGEKKFLGLFDEKKIAYEGFSLPGGTGSELYNSIKCWNYFKSSRGGI